MATISCSGFESHGYATAVVACSSRASMSNYEKVHEVKVEGVAMGPRSISDPQDRRLLHSWDHAIAK